jgi:hypothetical protein
MLVRTFASAVTGIDAVTVTIEVNESRGVQFFLVGLPDSAVRGSHQRIESSEVHFPSRVKFLSDITDYFFSMSFPDLNLLSWGSCGNKSCLLLNLK